MGPSEDGRVNGSTPGTKSSSGTRSSTESRSLRPGPTGTSGPAGALLGRAARCGVIALDRLLARLYGIESLSDDRRHFLRVSSRPTTVRETVQLEEGLRLLPGDLVVQIHFANAYLPKFGPPGPDLAWARRFESGLRDSLSLLASVLAEQPRWRRFAAIHGTLGFLPAGDVMLRRRLADRFGFVLVLRSIPGGRWWHSSFWAAFYSRLLVWAYNPGGRKDHWQGTALVDIWMSREKLLSLYGPGRSAE